MKVGQSADGKRGLIISNPEAIGESVFVSDAERGTTITTRIRRDDHGNHSRGVIELPQHWIGKKVHIRQFRVGSSNIT
jgi:hypothetical protein